MLSGESGGFGFTIGRSPESSPNCMNAKNSVRALLRLVGLGKARLVSRIAPQRPIPLEYQALRTDGYSNRSTLFSCAVRSGSLRMASQIPGPDDGCANICMRERAVFEFESNACFLARFQAERFRALFGCNCAYVNKLDRCSYGEGLALIQKVPRFLHYSCSPRGHAE